MTEKYQEVDFDKVRTFEDLITILKAVGIGFAPSNERLRK